MKEPFSALHSHPRDHGPIAPTVPSHSDWLHEVKQDGYRLIVSRDGERVRLFTRNGYDWTSRYPLIVEAARRIRTSWLDHCKRLGRTDACYATGDNFTFCPLVNDPNRTLGHIGFAQQARPHMPGDDPWGMLEIVLLLAIAICIFISAALAVA